jgi:Carboxypeptidase regulatory-like domain/Zinc carboxypeptidase
MSFYSLNKKVSIRKLGLWILGTFLLIQALASNSFAYTVRGDFENGSCENVVISGNNVSLSPKPYPNGLANSYFHCIVEGAQGLTLNFTVNLNSNTDADDFSHFVNAYAIYNYLQPSSIERPKLVTLSGSNNTIASFSFTIEQDFVHIVSRIPVTHSYINNFITSLSGNPYVTVLPSIGVSPAGLTIKGVTITDSSIPDVNKKAVYLRFSPHYSAEQSCPHQAEGLIRYLTSSESLADILRKNFIWHVVPLVNVDAANYGLFAGNSLGTDLENCGHSTFDPPVSNVNCPENFGVYNFAYQWIRNKAPLYYSYECHTGAGGKYGYRQMRSTIWSYKHAWIFNYLSGLRHTSDDYNLPIMVRDVESWSDYVIESGYDYDAFEITDEDGWNGVNLVSDSGLVSYNHDRKSMQRMGWAIAKTVATALNKNLVVGKVVGVVQDQSGNPLPGTEIKLSSYATSMNTAIDGSPLVIKKLADLSGEFSFDYIAQGSYRLEVARSGFQAKAIENINVLAGNIRQQNVILVQDAQQPLSISNISASLLPNNSAEIAWTSNRACAGKVDYSTSVVYGSQVTSTQYLINHRLTINNLQPSGNYNYRITCTESNSQIVQSSNQTFANFISQLELGSVLIGNLPTSSSGLMKFTLNAGRTTGTEAFFFIKLVQDASNFYQLEGRSYEHFDKRYRYRPINGQRDFVWGVVFSQYVNGKLVFAEELEGDFGLRTTEIYDKDFPIQISFRPWGVEVSGFGDTIQSTYSDRPLQINSYAITSADLNLNISKLTYSNSAQLVNDSRPMQPFNLQIN